MTLKEIFRAIPARVIGRPFLGKWIRTEREFWFLLSFAAILVFVIWIFPAIFSRPDSPKVTVAKGQDHAGHEVAEKTAWTCAMHPQIHLPDPGKCPICGMDLVPASLLKEEQKSREIRISASSRNLARVETTPVTRGKALREIFLSGRVEAIPNREIRILSTVSGRVGRIWVASSGSLVRAGDKLFEYRAAENKSVEFFRADKSGLLLARFIQSGDSIREGQEIYFLQNIDAIWVSLDAYEKDIPWLRPGQIAELELDAFPGRKLKAAFASVDGTVNSETRTGTARILFENKDFLYLPGMLARGRLQVLFEKDGMNLFIPTTAPLVTGKRALVYVERASEGDYVYEARKVTLGPRFGDTYQVLDGLKEGEWVVTEGAFKIDSSMQISAKKSLMSDSSYLERPEFSKPEIEGLTRLLDDYGRARQALALADFDKANQGLREFQKNLMAIRNDSLKDLLGNLKIHTAHSLKTQNIEEAREQFRFLSESLFFLLREISGVGEGYRLFYCPIYQGGAYWVARGTAVENPYLKPEQKSCGEDLGPLADATLKYQSKQSSGTGHVH